MTMSNHSSRNRVDIQPLGTDHWSCPWALRVNPIPRGADLIAQISVGNDKGLLIQLKRTGSYAMLKGGCVRTVPHNKIVAALANANL